MQFLETLSDGVLTGLRGNEGLPSSATCVRECMCVNGVRVYDWDVRTVFVESVFVRGDSCSSLDDYNRALNSTRTASVE